MKNNSFLSSEEIVKSFLSYLDDSIYSYAYLLDGSWGSGKTFFVKEILIPSIVKHEKEKKNQDSEYKEKRILYVSLYGIKETEEISRLLYLELRKVMADKMTTGRFLKKHTPQIPTWLGTTSKIVSDVIKDSKGIDIENIINKISTGFSLKNCIFIFDDLERTSCNVNDILGYINNFIEHDQVKVLLIANEAEINTASRLDVDPEELLVCLQDNLDFGFLESEENSGYNGSQSTTRSEKQKISLQKLMKRVEVVFARNQAYKQIKWRKTLDVTDEELKKYKPCYENHQVRSFTQTIPVSEDAIEVRMEIKYEKNTEGKIIVSGKTNLFDGAQLLISITPDGKFYGPSCKVNCLNGTFTSVPLGNGTNLSGKCRLSITMPVSSVQPIEFVKKAGMQYENLKGDFIVRDGISPSGKYEQEVIL